MTVQERSQFASKCKNIGDRGFTSGEYEYAVLAYEEGIRYLQFQPCQNDGAAIDGYDHGGENLMDDDMKIAILLFSKLAAAQLKVGEEKKALLSCAHALTFDSLNIEALLTQARSQVALGQYTPALQSSGDVLALDPQNSEALELKRRAAEC